MEKQAMEDDYNQKICLYVLMAHINKADKKPISEILLHKK